MYRKVAALLLLLACTMSAATILIDDANGVLANVSTSGAVQSTMQMTLSTSGGKIVMDDIAYLGTTLYGVNYTSVTCTDLVSSGCLSVLYSIDAKTGVATQVAMSQIYYTALNSLVAVGSSLYSVGLNGTLYSLSTVDGSATAVYTDTTFGSAGDLAAAADGSLYLTTYSGELVHITFDSNGKVVSETGVGSLLTAGSSTPMTNVYGLTFVGSTLYAVAGTTLYTVDLSTGLLTAAGNYTGLSTAFGSTYLEDDPPDPPVHNPEPATMALFATGLIGLLVVARKKRS